MPPLKGGQGPLTPPRPPTKVEDGKAAVRRADEVAGVGVCVEDPGVQQLLEVGDDADCVCVFGWVGGCGGGDQGPAAPVQLG